ncbi:alpha-mannosidase [Chamaesiphon sp.]|uniref:alpha-mannosidase n=1 Tax=Chamaesiphon sp. TaxID=2814140 RepID=UPI0035941A8B
MNDSEQNFGSAIERLRRLSQQDILTDWRMLLGAGSVDTELDTWEIASLNQRGQIAWERLSPVGFPDHGRETRQRGRQEIWLAQKLVMPIDLHGYPVTSLSCRLAFTWWAEVAQVFVDGKLVQEGDLFDHSPRVLLMSAVVPGTAIDVRLRMVSPGHDIGALMRSRLVFESADPTDPEPGWLADELAVMVKQVASFQPAQLEVVGGMIEAIDYDLVKIDRCRFIAQVLDVKRQIRSIVGGGGDLPTPPFGHPSQEGIFHANSSGEGILQTIQLLGHAHLDMAWLWEVAETWEVAERTFRSSLSLQQLFPDLTFCHSTPALYEWMELHQPDVFTGICQQVQAGKWEIVGGMWIEPDLNLISGESIARQIIYGQAYNRSRFGAHTRVAWLPDTFGFCWQLPQLLKQGGIDYFVTQKFLWNDTNQFPYQLFWWESPDGSRVFSLMSSPIGEGIDPLKMIDYACAWQTSTGINESLYLFGVGDHGGGPTRDMLEIADRWSKSDVFPALEFTTAVKYLDKLTSRADSQLLPVWRDELYLEFHRGCFTTHADQKRSNRQCEDLLYQAELWSSIACIVTEQDYPADLKLQIETAWKQTLFNQFHDIIPGTAIEPVYVTANEAWENVERVTTQVISNALGEICDRILLPPPPVAGAIAIVIFNALNWERTELVRYPLNPSDPRLLSEVGDLAAWQVFDADGNLLPSQSSAEQILFLATNSPSIGYRLFWLALTPLLGGAGGGFTISAAPQTDGNISYGEDLLPHPSPPLIKGREPEKPPRGVGGVTPSEPPPVSTETLASSDLIFKNQFVEVAINPETGDIASIYDRVNRRHILAATGANHLEAFQDGEQYWDAWNIDPKYAQKLLAPSQLKSIRWLENGAIRQCVRVVRALAGCEFTQDYILDAHSPIVQIKTSVDWQAEHILIKANFPLNLTADRSTAETACGAIDRPTTPQTPAEKAKWELPMHRWVDLTDNSCEYGVSILNDSKYGFDAGADYLRLTLFRSSKWPDPTADRGYHEFTYAIYPHSGTWQTAQTVRKGLELNSPLQVFQLNKIAIGNEQLRSSNSFLDLQAQNLILMAFKPSEVLDRSWVLRCYEAHGVEGEIELSGDLDLGIDRVVNILEEPQSEPLDDTIKPWQIRSFGISDSISTRANDI